jgi:hypothetical protein
MIQQLAGCDNPMGNSTKATDWRFRKLESLVREAETAELLPVGNKGPRETEKKN